MWLQRTGEGLTDGGFGRRAQAIDAGSILRFWRGEHEKTVWTQMELWQRFDCGPLELQPGAARLLRSRRDLLLKARNEATCAGSRGSSSVRMQRPVDTELI